MQPLLYLYEEQLMELLSDSQTSPYRALAFEWKEEDVYHVYTKSPAVSPTGYPVACLIQICESPQLFEKGEQLFSELITSYLQDTQITRQVIIGIFLIVNDLKLEKKAFRKDIGGISECQVKFIPNKSDLYSRSKGILETDELETNRVAIVGLGSFGSYIALELAKAGIGKFDLIDFDRVELSNLSRHICGVNDLGRFKTKAVKDSILLKNPYAQVTTHEIDINQMADLVRQLFEVADIIICATDNNRSRFNINEIARALNKTSIYGRAITRAEAGDVFVARNDDSACYSCLVGRDSGMQIAGDEEISSILQAERSLPAYVSPNEKAAKVQVGLSSDIHPICNLMVKLTLVELTKNATVGLSNLNNELSYNYYFWVNRRENHYTNFRPFDSSKFQPTILKWYGARIPRESNCFICNPHHISE